MIMRGDVNLKEYTPGRISFGISLFLIVAIALFFVLSALISSKGYAERVNAQNSEKIQSVFEGQEKKRLTLIIDPGHGGEDPGAVVGSIEEKNINLAVSLKLLQFLQLIDADIVITRTTDKMLYDVGEESRKKFYDLYNRLAFTKKYPDSVFISIHQNKFPIESCKGMQVFYGIKNSDSMLLANSIQSAVKNLQPDNHRTVKSGNSIYLLENSEVPSVIIECGFISNPTDSALLVDEDYTDKLAFYIFCGISQYLEDVEVEK